MSILKVNTIQDKGGNTLLSSDGAGTLSGGLASNTPSFYAYLSSAQSIPSTTATKAQCNIKNWDTDSAYDNSTNYRFTVPSGKDGKYVFNAGTSVAYLDDSEYLHLFLYKNGSNLNNAFPLRFYSANFDNQLTHSFSYTADLVAGDYIEFYIRHSEGASQDAQPNLTYFSGYKLIGA